MPYEYAYVLAAVNHSAKEWTRRTDLNGFVAHVKPRCVESLILRITTRRSNRRCPCGGCRVRYYRVPNCALV